MMYDAFPTVRRLCQEKGVSPDELLAHLLNVFMRSHFMMVGVTSRTSNDNPTVLNEIMSIANRVRIDGEEATVPTSVVDAMYRFLAVERLVNTNNAEVYRKPENVENVEPKTMRPMHEVLARHALLDEVLMLILKDGMNATEHLGLQVSLRIDEEGLDSGEPNTKA